MPIRDSTHPLTLYVGLQVRYFTGQDVVNWADELIAKSEKPSDLLIELSMARTDDESTILSFLRELSGEQNLRRETEINIGFLRQRYMDKRITLPEGTAALYALTQNGELTEEEETECHFLDDGLLCSAVSAKDAEAGFLAFTLPFWEPMFGNEGTSEIIPSLRQGPYR